MKKKKIIRLDFDGVIANSPAIKQEIASALFGKEVPLAEFSMDQIRSGKSVITIDEYRIVQDRTYASDSTERLVAIPGSIEAIQHWIGEGHDVRIVTARSGSTLEGVEAWLQRHGVSIPITGVGHRASKLAHLEGADLFIDDDPKHVREAQPVVFEAFLFRWPFNADAHNLPGLDSLLDLIDSNQN